MVNVGPETRPRTTTLQREFRSDEVADSKDLLRAVRCVIPKSGRSVKVTYLGIRSAHERVWLVEWKPIWLPRAYLTRGNLEPARGNLHVCKLLRDLTIIQIRTVTAEWVIFFVLSAFARRTYYIARKEKEGKKERVGRKEGRKEGRRGPEGEREKEGRNSYWERGRKRDTNNRVLSWINTRISFLLPFTPALDNSSIWSITYRKQLTTLLLANITFRRWDIVAEVCELV